LFPWMAISLTGKLVGVLPAAMIALARCGRFALGQMTEERLGHGEHRRCGLGVRCTQCPRPCRCGVGRWCVVCDGGRPAGDEEETATRLARRIQCRGKPVCPASPRRRSAGALERALHALSVQLVGPFCRCTLLVNASYGRGLAALCGPSLC